MTLWQVCEKKSNWLNILVHIEGYVPVRDNEEGVSTSTVNSKLNNYELLIIDVDDKSCNDHELSDDNDVQ